MMMFFGWKQKAILAGWGLSAQLGAILNSAWA
jgi:hypothetical protein